MQIGVIRETKVPGDSRCPLSPKQAGQLKRVKGIDIVVESSDVRIFKDDEFKAEGVPVVSSVKDCDILLGVKEVKIDSLIPGKTYLFFSHTIKQQSYNRDLLKKILELNIRLIDYEVLTDDSGARLIAFGRFAGIVGAHNGVMAYGKKTGLFELPRMKELHDYAEAKSIYNNTHFPAMRVVITGTGRVANGAAEVLDDMKFQRVPPKEYLSKKYNRPVYCQLGPEDYVKHREGKPYSQDEFYRNPKLYTSAFDPWMKCSDLFINGIYWDNNAPAFFTKEEMNSKEFAIKVIADVTCDIAPVSSVPSTLRPSTIEDPVYGYDPSTGGESKPYAQNSIDIMAVDNLPNELPRDASESFGQQLIEHILPEFFKQESKILERATIAQEGNLGSHFQYLKNYAGL